MEHAFAAQVRRALARRSGHLAQQLIELLDHPVSGDARPSPWLAGDLFDRERRHDRSVPAADEADTATDFSAQDEVDDLHRFVKTGFDGGDGVVVDEAVERAYQRVGDELGGRVKLHVLPRQPPEVVKADLANLGTAKRRLEALEQF